MLFIRQHQAEVLSSRRLNANFWSSWTSNSASWASKLVAHKNQGNKACGVEGTLPKNVPNEEMLPKIIESMIEDIG